MKRGKYVLFYLQNIRRVFSFRSVLAVILVFLSFLLDSERGFWMVLAGRIEPVGGSVILWVSNLIHYGMYYGFALVFLTIPFADAFCAEWNSGFTSYLVQRLGKKKYAGIHIGISALTGGVTYAMGIGIYLALLKRYYPFFQVEDMDSYNVNGIGELLTESKTEAYLLAFLFLFFLSGCMWGALASAVSVLITNRYVIAVVPYCLNRTYIEIAKAVHIPGRFRIDYIFLSKNIDYSPMQTLVISGIITILVWSGCWLFFQYALKRRLENDK